MLKSITLRRSLLALALSACATLASAATTFHIELNTLNLGTSGWIDLQFNPAPFDPVAATADLSHFTGSAIRRPPSGCRRPAALPAACT